MCNCFMLEEQPVKTKIPKTNTVNKKTTLFILATQLQNLYITFINKHYNK